MAARVSRIHRLPSLAIADTGGTVVKTLRILVPRTLALLALGALAQSSLQAQTSNQRTMLASYSERLASLEAELASMRGGGGAASCDGCDSVDCCCGPTWLFGYEAPYLQVHDGESSYGSEPSYRFIAGRRLCSGLGARVRYFDFEDRAGDGSALDIYAVDLEFTHAANFQGWNTTMSGGVRIAGFENTNYKNNDYDFDGAGLTFGVEFERTCWWRSLGLFGNLRGSLLFGDTDTGDDIAYNGTYSNEAIAVWEIQTGLQYERETQFGMLVSRIGMEAQLWDHRDNFGLVGPVASVVLKR